MKYTSTLLVIFMLFSSCEHDNPAFRFSNYYGTRAENLVKAIENDDIESIRREVFKKQADVNFKDFKYEVSLLVLSLTNDKKQAFEELLRLGADPNISNSYCVSPLVSAIRYSPNCDLFFIQKLLEYNANIIPRLSHKCKQAHDPIPVTILNYNTENKIKCGSQILKIITSNLDNPKLLFLYNNEQDYQENIVFNSLEDRNLSLLKYLIVDLNFKVPDSVYINGTVLLHEEGFKTLEEILKSREFNFNEYNKFREKAKNEILEYLENKK